jgi:hypothetical protein
MRLKAQTFKTTTSFSVLLPVHPCTVCFKWSQLGAHCFLVCLFQFLYMFRATVCPSSGERTVFMRPWYFSFCMGGCLGCWLRWDEEGDGVSSQPAHQTVSSQPADKTVSSQPADQTVSSQPADQTVSSQPADQTVSSQPADKTVSSQPADQTATHAEWKIPVSHKYSKFSWWWARSCPKHVESWNKYTKNNVHLVGFIWETACKQFQTTKPYSMFQYLSPHSQFSPSSSYPNNLSDYKLLKSLGLMHAWLPFAFSA